MKPLNPVTTPMESLELGEAIMVSLLKGAITAKTSFSANLLGLFGNMVGPVPDDVWKEMNEEARGKCEKPGCDCTSTLA